MEACSDPRRVEGLSQRAFSYSLGGLRSSICRARGGVPRAGPADMGQSWVQAGAALLLDDRAQAVSWTLGAVCRAQRKWKVGQEPHIFPTVWGDWTKGG